jgi:hypothetical protein
MSLSFFKLLFIYFIRGNERHCNTEVVQSSAALNNVGKENVILVIQFCQHEQSTLLSLIFQSNLLKFFTVVKKINMV